MSEQGAHHQESRRRYRIGGRTTASDLGSGLGGHVDDLVAGYALGALDTAEREAVDRHVLFCDRCADLLAEDVRTTGMLPFLATRHTPSPDIKATLFARIEHAQRAASVAQVPTRHSRPSASAISTAGSSWSDLEPPTTSVSAADASGSRRGWVTTALSLPLLVALMATGLWGMQLRGQVSQQSAEVTRLQSQLANFGAGATSYLLSPGAAAPQAEGEITLGADQRGGMVSIDLNDKQASPNQAYDLYVVKDGKLVPMAEVKVNDQGVGQAQFQLDQPFSEYDSVHVKAKPLAGADDSASADALLGSISGSIGSSGSGSNALP